MFVRRLGMKATESFAADEEVVLYREFWQDESGELPSILNEYSPGPGVVVWIRPAAEKK